MSSENRNQTDTSLESTRIYQQLEHDLEATSWYSELTTNDCRRCDSDDVSHVEAMRDAAIFFSSYLTDKHQEFRSAGSVVPVKFLARHLEMICQKIFEKNRYSNHIATILFAMKDIWQSVFKITNEILDDINNRAIAAIGTKSSTEKGEVLESGVKGKLRRVFGGVEEINDKTITEMVSEEHPREEKSTS